MKKEKLNKQRLTIVLIVYFVLLIWVVVFKCNENYRLSAEWNGKVPILEKLSWGWPPFRNLDVILSGNAPGETVIFFVNFLIFIPMGMLLPFFMKKRNGLLTILLVGLGIEIVQLVLGWGGFDTTDAIMYFTGGALGVLSHILLRPNVSDRTINRLMLWIGVIGGALAVFAVINTALHFPVIKLW